MWLPGLAHLLRQGSRFLHVSPEADLRQLILALPDVAYSSVDIRSPLAQVHADLQALPFMPGSFDAAMCNHVLHYVRDDRRGMAELFRVLRPGGWAVITVPFGADRITDEDLGELSADERRRRFGYDEPWRTYGIDLVERLESVGFDVAHEVFAERIGPEAAHRHGIQADESLIVVRRPPGRAQEILSGR
jgi:SAM-dependent methyltransferase